MYRENFGEHDQQAPVIEETIGFGQIQVQSLLGQGMAKMSPIKKMSYLQSRMHFDESMDCNADSHLEDGEMRKLLTSSLCAQGASPDAMESEEHAQTSLHQKVAKLAGRPFALFSPRRNEERYQILSSVFSGTLLAGNKDHLLNQARSDLARKEIHVESLNKCIDDLQKRTEVQDIGHYKKYNMNLLNLVENKLDCKRNCHERRMLALRDTQIRSKHEMEKIKRAQVQQVDGMSIQKHETIQQLTSQ